MKGKEGAKRSIRVHFSAPSKVSPIPSTLSPERNRCVAIRSRCAPCVNRNSLGSMYISIRGANSFKIPSSIYMSFRRTSAFTGRRTLCDVRWNALFETHFIINSPERTEDEPSLFGCFNSYRAVVTSSVLSILRDTERITIPSAFLISFTAVSPLTTATTLG